MEKSPEILQSALCSISEISDKSDTKTLSSCVEQLLQSLQERQESLSTSLLLTLSPIFATSLSSSQNNHSHFTDPLLTSVTAAAAAQNSLPTPRRNSREEAAAAADGSPDLVTAEQAYFTFDSLQDTYRGPTAAEEHTVGHV